MNHEQLSQLGARLCGEKASDLKLAVSLVEKIIPISDSYRELLIRYGGAIWFDNGARYKPESPTPWTGKDGYDSLDILFGLGDGKNSILRETKRYDGELPASFVPIGRAPDGNLICINGNGVVHFWDHEGQRNKAMWRIATSVDDFLKRLEPDDSESGSTEGIIESESFLNL